MTTRCIATSVVIALSACAGCSPGQTERPPDPQVVASVTAASAEDLATEVALYGLLTDEITRLGFPFVCVGFQRPGRLHPVDPADTVIKAVRADNPALRAQSECGQAFDSGVVIHHSSGEQGGVFVNVWRPAVERNGTVITATWYGSLRNGTLALQRTRHGWSLASADPSHSL